MFSLQVVHTHSLSLNLICFYISWCVALLTTHSHCMLQGAVAKQHLQAAYPSPCRASSSSSNLTSTQDTNITQHPHQPYPHQQQQQRPRDQQQHAYGGCEQHSVPTAALGWLQQQQQEEVSASRQDRLGTLSRWSTLLQGRLAELTAGVCGGVVGAR